METLAKYLKGNKPRDWNIMGVKGEGIFFCHGLYIMRENDEDILKKKMNQ